MDQMEQWFLSESMKQLFLVEANGTMVFSWFEGIDCFWLNWKEKIKSGWCKLSDYFLI
jgi:hypothetical protein